MHVVNTIGFESALSAMPRAPTFAEHYAATSLNNVDTGKESDMNADIRVEDTRFERTTKLRARGTAGEQRPFSLYIARSVSIYC